jgi:hypothetical protein
MYLPEMVGYNWLIIFQYYYLNIKIFCFEKFELQKKIYFIILKFLK